MRAPVAYTRVKGMSDNDLRYLTLLLMDFAGALNAPCDKLAQRTVQHTLALVMGERQRRKQERLENGTPF